MFWRRTISLSRRTLCSIAKPTAPLGSPAINQLQPHWFTSAPSEIEELNANVIAATEKTPKFMDTEGGAPAYRAARHTAFKHGDPEFVEDVTFFGPDLPASGCRGRLFFPGPKSEAQPRGALLHLHGGGFTSGSAMGQNDDRLLRHAANTNLTVFSVDYRLSPENVHPAALLDSLAGAAWLDSSEGRAACKISAQAPLLLVGESAGGYLAASMLIKLRQEAEQHAKLFKAVALTYGWFDMGETPYFKQFGEKRLVETADELRWFRSNYLGESFPAERLRDPDVSPLYADLRGLPPAIFSVGTEDALLEDSLFMYMRWLTSGNAAELRVYPGAAHGMGHFGPHQHTEQGEVALQNIEAFYNQHLP